jgi:hypothetical protein
VWTILPTNLSNFAQRQQKITDRFLKQAASGWYDEPDRQSARLTAMQVRPGDITMTIRTTRTTVSFSSPFTLQSLEGVQPAGEYVVLIDDELIEGLSRLAYRRVATLFQTPAVSASKRRPTESFAISQTELDAALMKDRQQTIVVH